MTRFSAVQKEILIILTKGFIGGVREAKSTDVGVLRPFQRKVQCEPQKRHSSK